MGSRNVVKLLPPSDRKIFSVRVTQREEAYRLLKHVPKFRKKIGFFSLTVKKKSSANTNTRI